MCLSTHTARSGSYHFHCLVNDICSQLESNDIYGPTQMTVSNANNLVPVYEEPRRHPRGAASLVGMVASAVRAAGLAARAGGRVSYSVLQSTARASGLTRVANGVSRHMPSLRAAALRPGIRSFIRKAKYVTDKYMWPSVWVLSGLELGFLGASIYKVTQDADTETSQFSVPSDIYPAIRRIF